MNRQLTALILMLALSLHSALGAFAAIHPVMQSDCQTVTEDFSAAHKSCCPSGGLHTASCCLDACSSAVALTVPPSSLSSVSYHRPTAARQVPTTSFLSRVDSPLIRPPIL
jgi:hypothetical protein